MIILYFYTFHHNNISSIIFAKLANSYVKNDNAHIFTDMKGRHATGGATFLLMVKLDMVYSQTR